MGIVIGIILFGLLIGYLLTTVVTWVIVKQRLRLRRSPGYRTLWLPLWCVVVYWTLVMVSSALFVVRELPNSLHHGSGMGALGVAVFIRLRWGPTWMFVLSPAPFVLKKILDNYPLSGHDLAAQNMPKQVPVMWLISLIVIASGGVAVLIFGRRAAALWMNWLLG